MHGRPRRSRAGIALALTGVAFGLSACADYDPQEPESSVAVPDIRGREDLEDVYDGPLNANFREEVGMYAEQEITLLAEVAEVLSPRTFTITAVDGADVEPLLVVATSDAGDVELVPGAALVVAGTPVAEFDAAALGGRQSIDLEPEVYDEWDDDPYVLATDVEPAP